jgi:hypothetical protein
MGFLPAGTPDEVRLGQPLVADIAREMQHAGIGAAPAARLRRGDVHDLLEALRATVDAIDASPRPEGEWGPAREILTDDLLAEVLGDISVSSVRRYAAGKRRTPDDVAWRLHTVARVLAALVGSYNGYGIRRWFVRPRSALEGARPVDVIAAAPGEHDVGLQAVIRLAEDLVGAGPAT